MLQTFFIFPILIFILGISLGSFSGVIQYRVRTKKKGIFFGRSACSHCKHPLKSKDLFPLLSYIFLLGKCRYCEKKIGFHSFLMELMMGTIAVFLFFKFPFFIEPISSLQNLQFDWQNLGLFFLYLVVSFFLVGIFFYDLQYLEIPDVFLFPLIPITFLGNIFFAQGNIIDMFFAGAIALVFFGGQIFLSKGKWLGEGDLYLGFSMAFLFGWKLFLLSLVMTYFIGALVSIVLLLSKKVQAKSKVPFAPFMVAGTFVTIFYGIIILNWYLNVLAL